MKSPMPYGIALLIIKASLLGAGITLWRLPMQEFIFVPVPLYQTIGTVLLGVLAYIELSPFLPIRESKEEFFQRLKKRPSMVRAAGLRYHQ